MNTGRDTDDVLFDDVHTRRRSNTNDATVPSRNATPRTQASLSQNSQYTQRNHQRKRIMPEDYESDEDGGNEPPSRAIHNLSSRGISTTLNPFLTTDVTDRLEPCTCAYYEITF